MCIVLVMAAAGGRSTDVLAGAWNEPAGQGLVILDYTFSGGSKYFDGAGKLSPAAAYSKQEAIGYLEFGVTDWLTMIAKPSFDLISAASSPDPGSATSHYAGLGTSEAGAQVHLLTYGPAVFAMQGSFRLPGTVSHSNPAEIGNTSYDAEARGLFGIAFTLGRLPAYLDIEAAYRLRSSGASAEWHADATVGLEILPRWLLVMQSFTVFCDGKGTLWFPPASYSKLAAGVVHDLNTRWSVELEAFQTVWGDGALRYRGLYAEVWYRF